MKTLAITLILSLISSCTPAQRVKVKAALTAPVPVPVEQILFAALDSTTGTECYITKSGTQFKTDGTVPCPPQEEVEFVLSDVGKKHNVKSKDVRWENLSVIYTNKVIECGGVGAMGCTLLADPTVSVVSLYYPWRRSILRHELTHVMYMWNKQPEMRHFCLDNPDFCNGAGELMFPGE